MNWLAHLFLSQPQVEARLGNILADLVKGKEQPTLNSRFYRGIKCHLLIDSFADRHLIIKRSKQRIIAQYKRYSGLLVDISDEINKPLVLTSISSFLQENKKVETTKSYLYKP
ncbi:MAG: hypothetical protein Tsb0014_24030 [Pleurocapsa sp.]